jgi:predicted HicB family RNase H-like nuclease
MTDTLEYKNYFANVHFNAEDDVFYSKIIGINDLVSFEGTTVKEIKKAFHEAVEDYLETCKLVGKDPDKTYKGTFNVRISTALHREAVRYAAIKNITLNDLVKQAITSVLTKSSVV